MKTYLDCIPCFLRQALEMARMSSSDPAIHEHVLREVLSWVAHMDMNVPPPVMARRIHRYLKKLTNNPDPYQEVKLQQMTLALKLAEEFRAKLEHSPWPFGWAARLAIGANVIDSGINCDISEAAVRHTLQLALEEDLIRDLVELEREIQSANEVLYLADNAGEIVFDRLLIERIKPAKVTVVVREAPILNDVTIKEAQMAGLHKIATIISSGVDAPGILLDEASPELKTAWERANVIIAKGQGNFETLWGINRPIYFLFKVKCAVVAKHVGWPIGTFMAIKNQPKECF